MDGAMKMTSAEIENRIASVNATMNMEGMILTEEEKSTIRGIICGDISCDEAVKKVIKEFSEV